MRDQQLEKSLRQVKNFLPIRFLNRRSNFFKQFEAIWILQDFIAKLFPIKYPNGLKCYI